MVFQATDIINSSFPYFPEEVKNLEKLSREESFWKDTRWVSLCRCKLSFFSFYIVYFVF